MSIDDTILPQPHPPQGPMSRVVGRLVAVVLVAGLCASLVLLRAGDASAGTLAVHVAPSTARLTPGINVSGYPRQMRLQAARGEREGGQLVLDARGAKARLTVKVTSLSGPSGATIGADQIIAYREAAIRVRRASPRGRTGIFYDGLVPASGRTISLRPRGRAVLWIDVSVPTEAVPGRYRGSIVLRRANGSVRRVPITLRVYPATLPARPFLQSSVGVDRSQIERFERDGSRTMLDRYFQTLADARLSPADPNVTLPTVVTSAFADTVDGQWLARIANRRGISSLRVPIYQTWPFADPLGADRAQTVQYLRSIAAYYRAQGWLERSYVYAIDEPTPEQVDDVRAWHTLVKEADPGLRLLVTTPPRREYQGAVDIWVPNISAQFDPAAAARERSRGRPVWWYPSISTHAPYPTMFIDDLRAAPRAYGWLAFRYGIDGFLYWSATHWHEVDMPWRRSDTFHVPGSRAVGNGDGTLLYPGRAKGVAAPLPSIRLLQTRDGIEDHDLLVMASHRLGVARAHELAAALAPSLTQFTSSGTRVAAVRRQLLAAAS